MSLRYPALLAAIVVAAVCLGSGRVSAFQAQPALMDPATLNRRWFDAITEGDVVGALALMTDDATVDLSRALDLNTLCSRVCRGAAIAEELERQVGGGTAYAVDMASMDAAADRVSALVERGDAKHRAAVGYPAFTHRERSEMLIAGEKITAVCMDTCRPAVAASTTIPPPADRAAGAVPTVEIASPPLASSQAVGANPIRWVAALVLGLLILAGSAGRDVYGRLCRGRQPRTHGSQ